MFAILKANGCEVEFVRYPGSHHLFPWTGEPAHIEDFLQRILDWFLQHLGMMTSVPTTGEHMSA